MHPIPSAIRYFFAAAFTALPVFAVPTAVNDSFTTPEDTAAGSAAVDLVNASFETGGAGAPSFTLPANWQSIDLKTTAAGGTNTYPVDGEGLSWKAAGFDAATSTISGWRAPAALPVQGGGINAFSGAPEVLTGIVPGSTNTVNTYLFRNQFTMTAAQAAHPTWSLNMLADDGAIVYINGVEKTRLNYPADVPVNPDALVGGNGGDETNYTLRAIDLTGAFVAGTNVIAIELHQNAANSSDAGLDFQLTPASGDVTGGFTGSDDAFFGTGQPDFSAQTHAPTGGFNSTGGLRVQMGNVRAFGSSAVSGAWSKTFSLTAPATVSLSFRHRLISGQDYDGGEFQELLCDVDGTLYGTTTSPSTHNAVNFQVGNGNGGGSIDSGWKQSAFSIPLAAGTHTLKLGGYGNVGTNNFQGTAQESFEGFFDDVVLAVPGSVSLLANDTGGVAPVTAVKASDAAHGTVTVNPDGSFNYAPELNWSGSDSFTYRAVDATGSSNPATVTLTVTPVNDVPVAVNDGPFTVAQDGVLTTGDEESVLRNDTDVESTGLTAVMGTASPNGVTKLNANGTFTFTPTKGFSGTATFTYLASDGTGQSAPATVTIIVANLPDPPVAVNDTYTAVKNTPLVVTALTGGTTTEELLPYKSAGWHYYDSIVAASRNLGTAWRTDAYTEDADWKIGAAELGYGDGDEATVIADNATAGFDASATDRFATSYFRRSVDVASLYSITAVEVSLIYDDAVAFYFNGATAGRTTGLPDTAAMPELAWDYYPSVNVNDNSTQTFTLPPSVLVDGTNLIAAEVHQNGASSSDVSFDFRLRVTRAIAAGLLANDSDADPGETAGLTAEVVTPPAHGTVEVSPTGTFTYTPAAGYTGPDSFTYRAKDPGGLYSAVATAGITVVTGPNVAPVARPDTYAAVEDTPLSIGAVDGVLANDTDAEGDPFTAVVDTPPAHGSLTLHADGSFVYQPAANYSGPDAFTYRAADTKQSAPATVSLTVGAVNDVPVAVNDSYAGDPGVPLVISAAQGVLANDSDVDPATVLTAEVEQQPSGGALTLNADGSFTFNAPSGGVYTFTYRARDAVSSSAPATVTIALNAVPVTQPETYHTDEDQAIVALASAGSGVLQNDADPEGQPLTAQLVDKPQHGVLVFEPDGGFHYTPALNFFGTDSFTYRASDGTRVSAPVTVTVTVIAVNDAPVALDDSYGGRVDATLTIAASSGLLRNDTDVDSGALTAVLVTAPEDGVLELNPDGAFAYTPVPGFSGARTFTYRASDGKLQSAVTTVTLNITTALNTVAISEIMYNPPGATGVLEEFVEIYNYGDAAVELTGWAFTKGIDYAFPAGLLIPAHGYLAVPADRAVFAAKYPAVTNVTATGWGTAQTLSNSGELLRLANAAGETVDETEYADEGDWAIRKIVNVWDATNTPGQVPPSLDTDPGLEWVTDADPNPEIGITGGASIQLRNVALSNKAGQNWAAAAPTPGAANTTVGQTDSAPLIRNVAHSPAVPNHTEQVFVTARIDDELAAGTAASIFYRTWLPSGTAPATAFTEVPMADNGLRGDGAAGDGVFGAVIPAQALNTVVEFYVRATDAASNARTWPAPVLDVNGLNPSQTANCLYQVNEEVWNDHRPLYQMVMTGADNASWNAGLASRSSNVAPNTTVIFRTGTRFDIRYLGGVRTRGNSSRNDTPVNLRMDIPKDNPWNGRTAFTLNYKYSYSQFLASRLFEAAGVPSEKSNMVGGRINGVNRLLDQNGGRTFGYYCDLIPRGGETIKEWFPGNDDGNGYGKIRGSVRWGVSTLPTLGAAGYAVGGYVNEGYVKQTNAPQNDWTDLHAWMQSLNAGTADTFHTTIANTVDVDEWCRFLALSTIVNHAETNMANGDDDDYSVYFGASDRLCRIIAHDLDTCFNLNAIGLGDEVAPPTLTIYQCTEANYPTDNATLPQMDKFYRNPVLGRKFKAALRRYLDTLFTKTKFDATVDQLLDSRWMGTQFTPNGDAIRAHIKSFMDTRRATIETFLPTAFTAATTLAVQNGLPRSTSATDLGALGGKIDPVRTASVTVNGVAVTTNPYGSTGATDNTWSAGSAVTLRPGLNSLLCEARDESGSVFASQTVTIWYDAAGVNKSGTLAASETWTPAGGPYNVTAGLTVPGGVTLTIEPGTTVFLASGAGITVSSGGSLTAPGTAASGITLTRIPSGTGNWGGITVNGGSIRLSYVTFENNGSTAVHTQNGAVALFDHLTFRNPGVQYLSLDASSFSVSDCVFPTPTAAFEPVHGSGGIASGGQAVIRNCWFGKTQGYNDTIDFTGGNRPGPVLQVLSCVFTGSDDDILDLDSTDAWVEGNVFLHCHRNGSSPDSSSAVSGGADNADYSQVTVINNLFYDCDNAVTMKQGNSQPNGNSAVLLNNTIVHTTKTGGIDTGSGVVNFDDEAVSGEGKGMYLEGNIIWDAENLTRNYDPALSQLTMQNNLLPAAPPASATASGNIVTDPLLNLQLITSPATATAEQVIAALEPQPCSPAIGAGPLGRNLGASLSRPGITVATPPGSVWPSSVSLAVGPAGSFTPTGQAAWSYGFVQYRFRLDDGETSAAFPSSQPLVLSGLAPGAHTLLVEGRNDAGIWQAAPVSLAFRVAADAPPVVLSEVLADSSTGPDMVELHNWGTVEASLTGCMLSDDALLPGKFTFPAGTPAIPAGGRLVLDATQLGFSLSKSGETLRFASPSGELIDAVTFGPQLTNYSISRSGSVWQLAVPSPWTASTAVCALGSAGALRINEWLGSNSLIVPGDFVELYNTGSKPVNAGGYSLSQDFINDPMQSPFPPLSFVAGGGFLELTADGNTGAGADHLGFKISRIRDSLTLVDAAGAVVDSAMVLPGNPDVSQGRTPDGSPVTAYLALPTPGFSNGSDLTADTAVMNGLRITEIMFAPPGGSPEFIEFKNISAAPLDLAGVTFTSGISFVFPDTLVPAGGYVVITNDLARFQSRYPGVPALQWSGGRLDNAGESIRIETGGYGLGILDFEYGGDWYPDTRSGAALEFINPLAARTSWGEPSSWQSCLPSPGGPSAFGVLAPSAITVNLPDPAMLNAIVCNGSYDPAGVSLAWSRVSGPGGVSFTAPANRTTDAVFTQPGIYELRVTLTPPGGGAAVTDSVVVTVMESLAGWTDRTLAAFPAESRLPEADADGDGQANLIEYVMGTDPAVTTAGPEAVISDGRLALRYTVSKFIDPAIQILPQASSDLGAWHEGGEFVSESVTGSTGSMETRVAVDTGALSADGRTYLRLKVVQP